MPQQLWQLLSEGQRKKERESERGRSVDKHDNDKVDDEVPLMAL